MNNKGITLIALIITIIVLLILAAVSINMIMGDDGILHNAELAKINTDISNEKEYINRAILSLKTSKNSNLDFSVITASELQNKLDSMLGNDMVLVSDNGGTYTVLYNNTNRSYDINPDGTIAIDWDEILENSTIHPEQDIANADIGVDSNGNPVNLNYWYYYPNEEGGVTLGSTYWAYSTSYNPGYIGSIEDDGTIQGNIPQYIKIDSTWYSVTSMGMLFSYTNAQNLKTIEPIPSTVTSLYGSFYNCSALESITIPSTVTNLNSSPYLDVDRVTVMYYNGCFSNCQSLTTIYIPSSVGTVGLSLFSGCTNLETINFEKSLADGETWPEGNWMGYNCSATVNYGVTK